MSPFCSTRSSYEELVDSLTPNSALSLLAELSPLHHRCSPQPRRLDVGAGNKSPIGKNKRGTGGGRGGTGVGRGGARPGGGGPGKRKMCRLGCGQPKASCKGCTKPGRRGGAPDSGA